MAITTDEVIALADRLHDLVMLEKGDAAAQGAYFLHPEPRIFVPHGEDLSLRTNFEIHQKLADEVHAVIGPWTVEALSTDPERARARGAVYWSGRPVERSDGAVMRCIVGEEWIVQRVPSGELKIALYINTYHHFLPDSAAIELA